MNYRNFGRTGWQVSEVSFGAWAIGSAWGEVDDEQSVAAMHAALDTGVNLIDTADVYGDGRSERLIARLRKERGESFYAITKAGRRLDPHTAAGYNLANLTAFVERSLKNLDVEALDLVQLHCPPTESYYMPEVFDALNSLVTSGKIRFYGVSVEKVEEALKAIEYPHVQSVQIIFNMLRHRPAELFFPEAKRKQVAILARVPLASGLLTGKMSRNTTFASDDHRSYNRYGQAFDRGETFSGVDFETGLQAVEKLRGLLPEGMTMTQFALRWILMFDAVSCAIPGAKTPEQAAANSAASAFPPLTQAQMDGVQAIYNRLIREQVHQRW